MPIYVDCMNGAKEFIKKETNLIITSKTEFIPDPHVNGVWKVIYLKEDLHHYFYTEAIIFMAGYKDPFGVIRKRNDFETGEMETIS